MIEKYKKKYKSVVFKKDEKVLVRLKSKGGKGALKRRFVVEGKVINKSERAENYKVSLVWPGETVQIKLWIGMEDITALKKDTKQLAKERREYGRRHFLIPLKKCDRIDMFKSQGYQIIFDPSGDGSCQFSAIAYFLLSSGFDCSANQLREEVVDYLKTQRKNEEGQPARAFCRYSLEFILE